VIVSGHQPNYLPWLGFFDKMRHCDVFIIQDNVQFERQGFINRTKIKTTVGVKWLTVPIRHAGTFPIKKALIAEEAQPEWARNHWLGIRYNYCKAPHWKEYSSFLEEAYSQKWARLIDLNMHFIKKLMSLFDIKRPLISGSSLGVTGKKSELVLAQCKALGATVFFSGTGARSYLNTQCFAEEGIEVVFQNFVHPVYPQPHGDFAQGLSVIDYLFNVGAKSWKTDLKI
jgi:hypothetical protein